MYIRVGLCVYYNGSCTERNLLLSVEMIGSGVVYLNTRMCTMCVYVLMCVIAPL